MVRKESLEARAKVITKFIATCEALLRLNNYNSLFAVLGGLNNPGVNRLAQSWEVRSPRCCVCRMLCVLCCVCCVCACVYACACVPA